MTMLGSCRRRSSCAESAALIPNISRQHRRVRASSVSAPASQKLSWEFELTRRLVRPVATLKAAGTWANSLPLMSKWVRPAPEEGTGGAGVGGQHLRRALGSSKMAGDFATGSQQTITAAWVLAETERHAQAGAAGGSGSGSQPAGTHLPSTLQLAGRSGAAP